MHRRLGRSFLSKVFGDFIPWFPGGEVFVAKLQINGNSVCPPAGTYASLGIGRGPNSVRAFLTKEQARRLGKWLNPPAPSRSRAAPMPPTSLPAVATEWAQPPAAGKRESVRRHVTPPMMTGEPGRATSEDKLVTARFVLGLRERHAQTPTDELERELATFEPDLAAMVRRLIEGTVEGPLAVESAAAAVTAEACCREAFILLLALRGAFGDLWHGVLFGVDHSDDVS